MVDFAGIFDSIRSGGDDVSAFFSSSLGEAALKGAGSLLGVGGDAKANRGGPGLKDNFVEVSGASGRARDIGYEKSEDFSQVEYNWYKRMERFANLSDTSKVQLGNIK